MLMLNSSMMIPTSILLLLVLSIFFLTPTEQSSTRQPSNYGGHFCLYKSGNYTKGSIFEHNLNTLLSDLESNSSSSSFFKSDVGEIDSVDHIFGRYNCRHDVAIETCHTCVKAAAKRIVAECSTAKEAVMFYEYCTLVYLNSSARLDDNEVAGSSTRLMLSKVIDVDRFYPIVVATMNRLTNESAYEPTSQGFATREAKVSELETLYSMTQCSPDMVGVLCERCLKNALYHIDLCCKDEADMFFFYPNCQMRYSAVAPFYSVRDSSAPKAITQAPTSSNHSIGNDAVQLNNRNIFQPWVVTMLIPLMLILTN